MYLHSEQIRKLRRRQLKNKFVQDRAGLTPALGTHPSNRRIIFLFLSSMYPHHTR